MSIKIKHAGGNYKGVRAITEKQAINLARKLFDGEEYNLHRAAQELKNQGEKMDKIIKRMKGLKAKEQKCWNQSGLLDMLMEEIYLDLAIKHKGYIVDYLALNLIAKDQDDSVYCFVWERKEIWIYDGDYCPDPSSVEKVEWRRKKSK